MYRQYGSQNNHYYYNLNNTCNLHSILESTLNIDTALSAGGVMLKVAVGIWDFGISESYKLCTP